MRETISKHSVYKLVKQYWDGEVSQEVVDSLHALINDFLGYLIDTSVQQVKEDNDIRKACGLREKKRICGFLYINLFAKCFKRAKSIISCELGYQSKDGQLAYNAEDEVVDYA